MMLKTLLLSDSARQVSYRNGGPEHPGASAPIILLHGVGLQSAAWNAQAKTLAKSHTVVALDLPGHGASSPLSQGAALPAFVDWLAKALDAMQIERTILVGHSMGALIASGFGATWPERTEGVALLNGVYRRDSLARDAVIQRAKSIGTGSFDVETPLNRWFPDSASHQEARAKTAQWLSEVDIGGYATAYAAFAEGDETYAEEYPKIACPFLAVTGELDRNSTPAMSHTMASEVRHGKAIVVKGHGHMMCLTAADRVTEILTDWLVANELGAQLKVSSHDRN